MPVITKQKEDKKKKQDEERKGKWIRTSPSPGVFLYDWC